MQERIVDTRKYRYKCDYILYHGEYRHVIMRLERMYLDTTTSINGWKLMEVL
jgi:hypothetical protein